jgi:hypothetical protein
VQSTVEVYEPRVNRWRRLADLKTPRGGMGIASVNGSMHILGGVQAVKLQPNVNLILESEEIAEAESLSTVEIYNAAEVSTLIS